MIKTIGTLVALLRKYSRAFYATSVPTVFQTVLAFLYILLGMIVYKHWMRNHDILASCNGSTLVLDERTDEPLTWTDAFYFAMVTISTVGYGDMTPHTAGLEVFTIFYILGGIVFVFARIAWLVSTAMNWVRKLIVRAIECFDTAPNDRVVSMNDIIVPLDANTKVEGKRARQQISGRSKGISGRAVDLNGDGDIDFIEPPDFFTFWAQELIPATVLIAIIQLASALIFTQLEDMQYHEAFWHCMVTATTVGYGDVSISTQSGRLFAGFHIAVSVSWLAALVGEVAHLQARRSSEVARAELLQKTYTDDEILRLDANGDGVDKLEFVVGMLMILGVELCGEPLRWKDVRPFVLKVGEAVRTRDCAHAYRRALTSCVSLSTRPRPHVCPSHERCLVFASAKWAVPTA